MVHVEPDEVEELVRDVGGEGGDEHQHDAGDGIADGGKIGIDRRCYLGHRHQEDHHEDELGEDKGEHEGDPLGEPAFGGIPRCAGECDGAKDDRDQQQGFADEEGEPDDGCGADGEGGEEDGDDGTDTRGAHIDGGESDGKERDAVAHALHRVTASEDYSEG